MNIAVFASGRGSNLNAIINAIQQGKLRARVCLVLSNNSGAGALEIARSQSIPALHLSQKQHATEEAFHGAMIEALRTHATEFIALAGYMKHVPSVVIREFRNRIVNVHPALLPSFGGAGMYGHHVHDAVIAYGAKVSGATVHLVDEEYDHGAIVLQRAVEVAADETSESLAAKVLTIEHELLPIALSAFADGRIKQEGRNIWILP